MHIENIRAGFATNSSSTHSIIVLPTDHTLSDVDCFEGLEFGWSDFVLASGEAKMGYFAAQMYQSLEYSDKELDTGTIARVVHEITGIDVRDFGTPSKYGKGLDGISVDHQSAWGLRGIDHTNSDHVEFLKELGEYIRRDSVVIFGGNDNNDENPYIPEKAKRENKISNILEVGFKIIRKDGDYFTFFNNSTGMKVRLTLKDDAPRYTKSTTPELVDLKITQYCPFGCEFCYMGSTKEGVHAPLDRIKRYIDMMADMRVFEIALGGGEPTMHPDFVEILQYINSKNMVANFTTFSTHWLKDEAIVTAVKDCVSAIGVSVLTSKCIDKVTKITNRLHEGAKWNNRVQVMAQHVLGSTEPAETINILTDCWSNHYPVLLLGYKKVGFGKNYTPYDVKDVLAFLKLSYRNEKYYGAKCNFLAVDTKFVGQFQRFIKEMGISSKLITNAEGKFSMYMDAVTDKIAPSSYCSTKKYVDMPASTEELVKIYSKY